MQFKNPQQAVVSAVLKGVYFYPLVLMQSRSLKASVVPWAQQDPQLLWSLARPIKFLQ